MLLTPCITHAREARRPYLPAALTLTLMTLACWVAMAAAPMTASAISTGKVAVPDRTPHAARAATPEASDGAPAVLPQTPPVTPPAAEPPSAGPAAPPIKPVRPAAPAAPADPCTPERTDAPQGTLRAVGAGSPAVCGGSAYRLVFPDVPDAIAGGGEGTTQLASGERLPVTGVNAAALLLLGWLLLLGGVTLTRVPTTPARDSHEISS